MKILFVAPRYHTNQHYIVKTLQDYGHNLDFFVLYVGGSEEYSALKPKIIEQSILFKPLNFLNRIINPRTKDVFKFERNFGFPSIGKYYISIKKFEPNIVICRERNVLTLITYIICKILKFNCMLYNQTPLYYTVDHKKNWIKRIGKVISRVFTPKVRITTVHGEKDNNKIRDTKSYYLPFVAQCIREERHYFRNNLINILSIGKFQERKNHIFLMDAIERLKDRYPIRLTIIGECTIRHHEKYLSRVRNHIIAKGLEENVEILLNMNFYDVQKEYFKNDLFILPSDNEPSAISHLEAMSHALPVLCSDTNGTKDYIQQGLNGYTFTNNDLDDLVKKIQLIIRDRKLLIDMGKHSIEIASLKYSPVRYHSEFMSILKKEFDI